MPISHVEARELVVQYLKETGGQEKYDSVILDDHTIEREFGWVFFYNSRAYTETKNFMCGLVGNAPLIVDRYTGELHVTGTGLPTECYIRSYEATGDPRNYIDYVGSRVSLWAASDDVGRNEVIPLLQEIFSIDLGHAKDVVEVVARGDSCVLDAGARKSAGEACRRLSALGIYAYPIPDLSPNDSTDTDACL